MKAIIMFPYLLCLISYLSYAQDLAVLTGTSLTITDGTTFHVNGLALTPSGDYTIAGPNGLSRTATPVGSSIDRVFNFSSPITNFTGDLTFFYAGADLNGTAPVDLRLQSNDGTAWSGELLTTLNSGSEALAHAFSSATLASVTATSSGIALSISKFNELKINLFPNPVISSFQISTELTTETLIYNNLGQVVFKSKEKNINVSQLSAGTYIIIVKDIDTDNFNTYQIIKL